MQSSSSAHDGAATTVASSHDVHLRKVVQDKVLMKMIKHVTQLTHGWVVLVVDDRTTRMLSFAVRMSDLTDCGVSIIERLELNRQPFPEMNVVYFVSPTVEAIRKMAADFADPNRPKYSDAYLFFLSHAPDDVLAELKDHPGLVARLKALQEVNVDFLALEKCAFSFDMDDAFHHMYSPAATKDDTARTMALISEKLVSVCTTMEEYPYIRYKADQPRMEQLAQMFQLKMNEFVAKNDAFVYAPNRGTLLFIDRGQDTVTPLIHESTFQAMIYDLLDVDEEQITYPAETNAGTVMKTAFLNENDKLWIEFRHTHIAKVSDEIGTRMAALSSSKAGVSLGKGKSTDLQSMAAALRELPEYRELLGKLSQHLFLAGKALAVFTSSSLLAASNLEQCLATGVDDSGKKLKHSTIAKQFEELMRDPNLTEGDRFRVAAIFALTQDTMKDTEKHKTMQAACLSKKYDTALLNMRHVGGTALYKQNANSAISPDELKDAAKRATTAAYSNARYDPKLKATVEKALTSTLDEHEYPFIIAPPLQHAGSSSDDAKKKSVPISLRKKPQAKGGKTESGSDKDGFSGDKMIVFVAGGCSYSELRSVYEVREQAKRDVIIGTTAFLKPKVYIDALANLHESKPLAPTARGRGAEVMPLSSGEIHIQVEQQSQAQLLPEKPSSTA